MPIVTVFVTLGSTQVWRSWQFVDSREIPSFNGNWHEYVQQLLQLGTCGNAFGLVASPRMPPNGLVNEVKFLGLVTKNLRTNEIARLAIIT